MMIQMQQSDKVKKGNVFLVRLFTTHGHMQPLTKGHKKKSFQFKRSQAKRHYCSRVSSSWSCWCSRNVLAPGDWAGEHGYKNKALTEKLLPIRAPDGHVFLHKEDLWDDLESGLIWVNTWRDTGSIYTTDPKLLLTPDDFVLLPLYFLGCRSPRILR